MSDPDRPPPQKPIPLILWAGLGFVAVLIFAMLLKAFGGPG
jgi:hypothetical protein